MSRMSPEVFAAECDALVMGAVEDVRSMLDERPRDEVLAGMAVIFQRELPAGKMASALSCALVRLVEAGR